MPYTKTPRVARCEVLRRLESIRNRLGTVTDTELAREIDVARPLVWEFRTNLGIPVYRRTSPVYELSAEQKATIFVMLRTERKYLQEVAAETGIHRRALRAYADEIGWTRGWGRPYSHEKVTVGKLTRARIYELYDSDVGQAEIAVLANVTRERIRQVITKSGRRTVRQKQAEKRAERLRAKRAQQQRRFQLRRKHKARALKRRRKFLLKADSMWKQGKLVREIASAYGVQTNSMNWHIFQGRKLFGMFRRRPGYGSNRRTDAQWRKILREPLYLWRGNVPFKVIATCCGVDPRTLRKWRRIGRERFGWFQ